MNRDAFYTLPRELMRYQPRQPFSLFLDDMRCVSTVYPEGPRDWVIVKSYDDFCSTIKELWRQSSFPYFVSFDHDLSPEHYSGDFSKNKTGLDCAKWLVEFCKEKEIKFPDYKVHSMNPDGKENIIRFLESAKNP